MIGTICRRIASTELPLLILVIPVLLFPRGPFPLAGLAVILGIWLARWIGFRRITLATPLDLPMLLLLAMSLQALYPSTDLALSLPKLYGIVVGVAVYYAVVNDVRDFRDWWIGSYALLMAAVGVAAVGLVGTSWITDKLPAGAEIYARLPRLIHSVQSSSGEISGIQPNELGGTLAFLLPVPFALLLWGRGIRWVVGAATLCLAAPVLVLTQSRSSLLAAAVVVVLLLGLRWWRIGYLMLATAVAGIAAGGLVGREVLYRWIIQADYVGDATTKLANRQEIWGRTLYMIQDFPFTGVGLNSFAKVLDGLYPSAFIGSVAEIPHAHNIYLQTAVDLGLAGLMALLGVCLTTLWIAFRVYRRTDGPTRGAIAGLGAGLLAYMLFGMTDAITLGAKPLPLLWGIIGLIVAADRLNACGESETGEQGVRTMDGAAARTAVALYWAIAVLFALMAYLVVAMAIVGVVA
ncbi:MAG TPA: O-antigen ligase family protein [Chloroflexota bacterium]|nr:O-antigen ligase family protein [Chloroflexota bacterium]